MTGFRIDPSRSGGVATSDQPTSSAAPEAASGNEKGAFQRARDTFTALTSVKLSTAVGLALGMQRLALGGIAPKENEGVRTRTSGFSPPPMPQFPPLPPRGPGFALAGGPPMTTAVVARAGAIGAGAAAASEAVRLAARPLIDALITEGQAVLSVSDAAVAAGSTAPAASAPEGDKGKRIVRDPEFGDVDIGAMEARMNAEIRSSGHLPENLRNPDALYGHFQRNSDTVRNSLQYFAEKRPERAAKLLENLRADNTVVIPKGYEVRISTDLTASIVPK